MSDLQAPLSRSAAHPDAYWHTMRYFGLYRLLVAGILFGTFFFARTRDWWENYDSGLYFAVALGYLTFGIIMGSLALARWPRFNRQLTLQAMGDIGFIVLLMYASGGVKSGLGLLLVVAIAGASLISQGRLALFYAALASIALLLEQTWQLLVWDDRFEDYSHAVMLSLSCFATAWLAHSFAKRTRQSEELALQRGVDLENLSQINQLVIRDMQDGVLVVDQQLRLRHHNARAEALLGVAAGNWRDVALKQFAPEIAELLADWLLVGQQGALRDYRLVAGGKELRLRFLPVGADHGRGTVIFIEDWSRVQEQARQLKLASLGRLTANIAHEIRNPLSSISHANQLLLEEDSADPTSRRLLQIIDDNVHRLDHMVQDVLQLSQRDRMRQEPVDLGEFLREFQEQYCAVEKIDPAGFILESPSWPIVCRFDRHHLHQVLWNLCRNGWRHGRKGPGSLRVTLQNGVRPAEIEIAVLDDGGGVPDEVRAHLFEPFFTTETNGTGLGLFVARELCESNGAALDYVESREGACFKIYLKMQS